VGREHRRQRRAHRRQRRERRRRLTVRQRGQRAERPGPRRDRGEREREDRAVDGDLDEQPVAAADQGRDATGAEGLADREGAELLDVDRPRHRAPRRARRA
jgi:hypothetical protein